MRWRARRAEGPAVMELINLVVALAIIGLATRFSTGRAPA
jgi:hypothetical protein